MAKDDKAPSDPLEGLNINMEAASLETLRAMALQSCLIALRYETRAVGLTHRFGEQEKIDQLQTAADFMANVATFYTQMLMEREKVVVKDATLPPEPPPATEEKPKKSSFFGNWRPGL